MRAGPPPLLEFLVGLFIPPACREVVLGDLHERYSGMGRYIADVLCAVPLVILSRIRRTADPQVLLMHAFVLYLSFWGAARFQAPAFLNESLGLWRLAIPAATALLAIVLEDAYTKPGRRSPLKAIRAPLFGLAMALLGQALLSIRNPELLVPRWVLLCGGASGLLLTSTIRMLFPPLADRPRGADGPAFWLQQAVEPLRISPVVIRVVKGVATVTVLALVGLSVGDRPGVQGRVMLLSVVLVALYQVCKRV